MTFGSARGSLACVALVLLAAPALAEPTPEDLASARELFKQGRALREAGDLPRALEKLRAAHALGQTPITGLELARTLVLVGRLVEAHEVSVGVARLPVASDETERSATARTEAAKLASELEPRLGTLIVEVRGLPVGTPPSLTVDGERVPPAAVGEPRRTDPGKHVAVLNLPDGGRLRADVELKEGETRTAVLDAEDTVAKPAATSNPSPPAVVEPSEPPPPPRRSYLLLVGGVTVTALGAATTTFYGVQALNAKGSLQNDCPGGGCGPSHAAELSSAKQNANFATGAFVVTLAGVGVVVLDIFLHAKKEPAKAAVVPDLGVGWVGAHGTF